MNRRDLVPSTVVALTLAGLLAACGQGAVPAASVAPASSETAVPTDAAASEATASKEPRVPIATALAGVPATIIPLGKGAAPIDVTYAFGSIWVSNHHFNSITRINPETLAEEAVVATGDGPGWFVATDDSLWVSNQMRRGLSRIDPKTNTMAAEPAGFWSPCWAPVFAFGSIWQAACDSSVIMRIDPRTAQAIDITTADYSEGVVQVGDSLFAVGKKGVGKIDLSANKVAPVGGCCGHLVGSDKSTVWLADEQKIYRIDVKTGKTVSTIPITFAGIMRSYGDHGWLIQESTAAIKIDLATDKVVQTLDVRPEPLSVIEAAGAVWVTAYGADAVWQLKP